MVPWELIAEINQSEHQCNQYTEDGEVGVKVWQVRQLLKLIQTMEAYILKRRSYSQINSRVIGREKGIKKQTFDKKQ